MKSVPCASCRSRPGCPKPRPGHPALDNPDIPARSLHCYISRSHEAAPAPATLPGHAKHLSGDCVLCGRGSKSLDPLDLSRLLCCILFHESGKPIRHPKIPGMKLRHRTNSRCQCAQTTTDLWFSFEQIFIGGDDSLKQVTRVKRGIHDADHFQANPARAAPNTGAQVSARS